MRNAGVESDSGLNNAKCRIDASVSEEVAQLEGVYYSFFSSSRSVSPEAPRRPLISSEEGGRH